MKATERICKWIQKRWTLLLVSFYKEMAFSDKIVIKDDVIITLDYRDPAFELKLRHEGYEQPGNPTSSYCPEQQHHRMWLKRLLMWRFCFQHTLKISADGKELLVGHGQKSLLLSSFDGTTRYADDKSWLTKILYTIAAEEQADDIFQNVVWGSRETGTQEVEIEEIAAKDEEETETEECEVVETEITESLKEIPVEKEAKGLENDSHEEKGMDIDFSLFR